MVRRVTIAIGFVLLLLVAVLPPMRRPGDGESYGRGFLFSSHLNQADYVETPMDKKEWPAGVESYFTFTYTPVEIDGSRLLCESLIVVGITGVVAVFATRRKETAE